MKPDIGCTQILREISKNPNISQREIALKHRISLGKVNYAIKSLIREGFIKIQSFSGTPKRQRYTYILTPIGMDEKVRQTTNFLKWKLDEYERMKKEIEELKEDVNNFL
jgi:EPS-associated MarR family transcriptional regulator